MATIGVFALVVFSLQSLGEVGVDGLSLDARKVGTQPWRLVTGHFVHVTWRHCALNAATFAVFIAAFRPLRRPALLAGLLVGAMAAVDAGVLLLHPEVDYYVGFSGVVYGLLAGALVLSGPAQLTLNAVVAGLLLSKLAADMVFGTPASTVALVGGPVLAAAHVYGCVGGVAAGLVMSWGHRARRAPTEAIGGGVGQG